MGGLLRWFLRGLQFCLGVFRRREFALRRNQLASKACHFITHGALGIGQLPGILTGARLGHQRLSRGGFFLRGEFEFRFQFVHFRLSCRDQSLGGVYLRQPVGRSG